MRHAPHSPLVPLVEPPMTRRERAALTAILLFGLAVVVAFVYGLARLGLEMARWIGGML